MRHWSHIQHKRSTFISEISVRAGSRPISLLCGIHHTIKITLVQSVPPAMCFASAYSVPRERKKKKEKKPSAGHHFHWQLVNKLKQRDAGTLFLPLLTLFLSPSSAVGNWCFPQKNLLGSDVLFRWCSWWKGYIIRAGCTAKTFSFISLHPYISALALHRCGFTGMESRQSKRVNHDRLV